MSEKALVNSLDIEELACHIINLKYDEIDSESEIIEEKLEEKFGVDLASFSEIVSFLLPLIDIGSSPLTNERFKGFSNRKGIWFCKIPIS